MNQEDHIKIGKFLGYQRASIFSPVWDDSRWQPLMECVEKINSFEDCKFKMNGSHVTIFHGKKKVAECHTIDTKNSVSRAILQFINYYNNNHA